MLRMCSDESGINPESRFCVVAGFVGEVEEWTALEKAWSDLLIEYGLDCFHSTDIFARDANGPQRSPYREWGTDRTDEFLAKLVSIIVEHKVSLVGSAVLKDDFEQLNETERRIITGAGFSHKSRKLYSTGAQNHPYFSGLAFAIQHSTAVEPSGEVIDFVFDRQDQYEGWATDFYKHWKELAPEPVRSRLGDLSFRDKRKIVGLQSADLAAHLWNRHLNQGLRGARERTMNALTQKEENRALLQINADVMNELLSNFPEDAVEDDA